MLTFTFDFSAAALVVEVVVFLLIILFGEFLRCKNGLFCTVVPEKWKDLEKKCSKSLFRHSKESDC